MSIFFYKDLNGKNKMLLIERGDSEWSEEAINYDSESNDNERAENMTDKINKLFKDVAGIELAGKSFLPDEKRRKDASGNILTAETYYTALKDAFIYHDSSGPYNDSWNYINWAADAMKYNVELGLEEFKGRTWTCMQNNLKKVLDKPHIDILLVHF